MQRLKTTEKYLFKSVNSKEENKIKFFKTNDCTLIRLIVGEELEFSYQIDKSADSTYIKTEEKVKSFSCEQKKLFVNTATETYLFITK